MRGLTDVQSERWTGKLKSAPVGRGQESIETIRQGLKQDGSDVSINKLCRWFEIPRRTAYYEPTKAPVKVQDRVA